MLRLAVCEAAICLRVAAQEDLFSKGNAATGFFYLETGDLLVHRPIRGAGEDGPKSAVRFLSSGDLFCFAKDGRHFAHCTSVSDCNVLRVDAGWLKEHASADPSLRWALAHIENGEGAWLAGAQFSEDVSSTVEEQPAVEDLKIVIGHR